MRSGNISQFKKAVVANQLSKYDTNSRYQKLMLQLFVLSLLFLLVAQNSFWEEMKSFD